PFKFRIADEKTTTLAVLEELTNVRRSRRIEDTAEQIKDLQDPNRKPEVRSDDGLMLRLQIHSKKLLYILQAIIEFCAEAVIGPEDPFVFGSFHYPYPDLYFHQQELIDYKSSTSELRGKHSTEFNSECDQHIDVLLGYLSKQPASSHLKNIEAPRQYQRPTITWTGLWMLFKPGTDAYVREDDGSLNAYVIERVDGGGPLYYSPGGEVGQAESYKIIAWNLSFDGENIWRRAKVIDIPIYDSEKEILELPVFPVKVYDGTDDGNLRKALIERGKKYFNYCKVPSYLEFTGTGMGEGARKINLLDVCGLEELDDAKGAIDYLVMKGSKKEVIKAIATVYTDTSDTIDRFRADFVRNKGEGQIILLHGPPGTGKTLTAEAIAEYTRRPLLSITGADLGHRPSDMEKKLLETFRKANDWDAIMLLDEADIYLQRRSDSLERNSVVTGNTAAFMRSIKHTNLAASQVFLRALEYFQGIFFLTTNRVGQFDEAIMSRIHVSIGYDELDDSARNKIWENLFRKLEESYAGSQRVYEYIAYGYATQSEDIKKLQWNGREIRNAFQTAVALAIFEAKEAKKTDGSDTDPIIPKLTKSHLEEVVGMSSAFRKYMTATHMGIEESDRAYKAGNRNDKVPG
ncbi:MAG: hypothetical protein Q9165_007771, partial [Trypethelium subeluteriae]